LKITSITPWLVKVEGTEVADTAIVADEVEFETP